MIERRRREYRGDEGAEGARCGVGVPPPHKGEVWRGGRCPLSEFFSILDIKMSTSGAFCALFFAVQLPIIEEKNTVSGLTKLAAVGKTSLLKTEF